MGVPTITSITPGSGSTLGGNIVHIEGANFRLPPAPSADGYVGGDQPKTVKVTVGGVESEWAYAGTSLVVMTRIPEWRGDYNLAFPLALDVRVANLDDAGVEIPGENVTMIGGYSVNQANLAEHSYLQRVLREILRKFRRHLLKNAHITTKRDYDDDTTDQERLKAAVPVVYLVGPRTPVNRYDSYVRMEPAENPADPDQYYRRKPPITVDIEFDIVVWAKTSMQLYGLHQALLKMQRDIYFIEVDHDPADPSKGQAKYPFRMPFDSYPDVNTTPNESDLNNFRASVIIKSVHVDDEDGTVVERGWRITDNDGEPVVDVQGA